MKEYSFDYQVFGNWGSELIGESDDIEEVWRIIDDLPFEEGYRVRSHTGKDCKQFIPHSARTFLKDKTKRLPK